MNPRSKTLAPFDFSNNRFMCFDDTRGTMFCRSPPPAMPRLVQVGTVRQTDNPAKEVFDNLNNSRYQNLLWTVTELRGNWQDKKEKNSQIPSEMAFVREAPCSNIEDVTGGKDQTSGGCSLC